MKVYGLICGAVLCCATPASAQTPPRCTLLAQVATSTLLQFVESLSRGERETVERVSAQMDHVSSAYINVGCEAEALGQAMDCVLTSDGTSSPRDAARHCLVAENLIAGRADP